MATPSPHRAAGGAAEWRRAPMLPFAAGLGYATSVLHVYGIGPLIEPISVEFGWSRAQVTVGFSLAMLVQALGGVFVGLAVDRFGPRRFALAGPLLIGASFALLGTATGTVANWYWLWLLIAICTLPVQGSIWTSAVASRFFASRGLALATTMCGASVAASLFPLLTSWYAQNFGWRTTPLLLGATWLVVAIPMIALFFRGAHAADRRRTAAEPEEAVADLPGATLRQGMLSSLYARLLFASLGFTFTVNGIIIHFVPILTDSGADPVAAGGIAAAIGIASIVGRFGTGLLLDRFRASLVGAAVFLLPVLACGLLLQASGSPAALVVAAAALGFTLGAEIDVIVYLVGHHFGMRTFGGLYGGLLAALAVGTATGPLAAAAVFDRTGSYAAFLVIALIGSAASSLAIGSLPRRPRDWAG